MNQEKFWAMVARADLAKIPNTEAWSVALQSTLSQLDPDDIIAWNHIFDQLAKDAYTIDLMAACFWINGGAGDDGFYYFRCWLIGRGKDVYTAALANPDTLANIVAPHDDAEAEIYAAAHLAWLSVTGKSYEDPYPARDESAELKGENWRFEDKSEMRRRFPRLAALYCE